MNPLERIARRIDTFQQRHGAIAFPFAVVKKFGDDQAGGLAALIAYYGFFAMFPLLLVFVSVLGIVLSDYPGLRREIVNSALGQFPVIGEQIRERAQIEALSGNWITVTAGLAAALWAGLGAAQAAQKAMNTVWDIPRAEWPNFLVRRVRAVLMVVVLGTIIVLSTIGSGFGSSGVEPSFGLRAAGWGISFLLNVVLFVLAYQVLTARNLGWRNVLPGALVAASGWTVLQAVGGFYLTNQVSEASDVYGTFALVIGLLVWIAIGAQMTIMCAEINVVWNRKLWPRSLVQPPLSEGDKKVYRSIVRRGRIRPEVSVRVSFSDGRAQEKGRKEPLKRGGPRRRARS